MKYSDLAPESGQNDTQHDMFYNLNPIGFYLPSLRSEKGEEGG